MISFLSEAINLTPHSVDIFDETGENKIWSFPSDGELRLKSAGEQLQVGEMQEGAVAVPLVKKQVFVGLDPGSKGYVKFMENDHGTFIVSMATAQFLSATADHERSSHRMMSLGARRILSPATAPGFGVRDATGAIIGCKALEIY